MEKDLDYYMGLNYPCEIKRIKEEDGGGYLIKVPLLKGCMSDGDTIEEAMKNIENAKECWLGGLVENGLDIPEPGMNING